MKNKKVILDTNLWISFLISEKFTQFDKLIEDKKIILIFSFELIEEFIEVVNKHKFKPKVKRFEIANLSYTNR